MNAVKGQFDMFTGETPTLQFGPTVDANGDAVDLTGAGITFVVRQTSPTGQLLITKTVNNGITILDQTTDTGIFTVTINSGDTSGLTSGSLYYEVRITLGSVILSSSYGYIQLTKSAVGR